MMLLLLLQTIALLHIFGAAEGFTVGPAGGVSSTHHPWQHYLSLSRPPRLPATAAASKLRASSASTSSTTTTKTKSSKKKKKARPAVRRVKGEKIQAISEQELVDHVSTLYSIRPNHHSDDDDDSDDCDKRRDPQHYVDAHQRFSRFPALVLNADYQPMSLLPLSLWNWQDAVKAVFLGKVTVVDVYPDTVVRAASLEIPLPAVIALNDYVPQAKYNAAAHNTPAFTRRNVFLRDGYRCQYCAQAFHTRDLSLDHVVPRSHGGALHWDNAVTSCRQCNGRKGSLLPHELRQVGMKLLKEPRPPTQYQLAQLAGRMMRPRGRGVHPTWEPYLGQLMVVKQRKQPQQQAAAAASESSSQ